MAKHFDPNTGMEIKWNLGEVYKSGQYSARYGEMTHIFEQAFAKKMGSKYAIAVNSGTSALFVSLLACGIGQGDEVIVPPIGPPMTANAVALTGATPIFADIDPESCCITEDSIMDCFGVKTAGVIVVNLFGNTCKIPEWQPVIEDCAQSLSALRGDIACYSFEQSKHICTGDGGMVVTNDPFLAKKVRQWSDHGMSNLTAGDGRWKGPAEFCFAGYNFRMPELSAALGVAQLSSVKGGKTYITEYIEDDKKADDYHQHLISEDKLEFARAPWGKLVYEWPQFGREKGLCPIAEKIHKNLFIFPVTR